MIRISLGTHKAAQTYRKIELCRSVPTTKIYRISRTCIGAASV